MGKHGLACPKLCDTSNPLWERMGHSKGSSQPCQLLGLSGFCSPVMRWERHPRGTQEAPAHVKFQEILINKRKAWEFHRLPEVGSSALPKCPAELTRTGHGAVPTPGDTPDTQPGAATVADQGD